MYTFQNYKKNKSLIYNITESIWLVMYFQYCLLKLFSEQLSGIDRVPKNQRMGKVAVLSREIGVFKNLDMIDLKKI